MTTAIATAECPWCEDTFEPKFHGRPQVYCSDVCRQAWWNNIGRKLVAPPGPREALCQSCFTYHAGECG